MDIYDQAGDATVSNGGTTQINAHVRVLDECLESASSTVLAENDPACEWGGGAGVGGLLAPLTPYS